MKFLLLFVLTSAGGGLGKLAGILLGGAMAPGAGLVLQLLGGSVLLAASVVAAEKLGAIRRHQRTWSIVAGVIAVAMATLVTLSTIYSPVAPYVIPFMIGLGAAMGSLIGKSAHERTDLT